MVVVVMMDVVLADVARVDVCVEGDLRRRCNCGLLVEDVFVESNASRSAGGWFLVVRS
jgi:hypothetical protein